jgi:hypothetical protein
MPHVPVWLADVVEVLVARYEAEAVILVGSQALGTARPESDYNLLALVDDEHAPATGQPLAHRIEALPGFARPVTCLRATLAEVMAGLYSGHPDWEALTVAVHPLHDPAAMALRIADRRRDHSPERMRSALGVGRTAAEAASAAEAAGQPFEAQLLLVDAALNLAREVGSAAGPGEASPPKLASLLNVLSPRGARALRIALDASDPAAGAAALLQAADYFAEALTERRSTAP